MVVRLARIQHHQQQIRRLAHSNDLPSAACAQKTGGQASLKARVEWLCTGCCRSPASLAPQHAAQPRSAPCSPPPTPPLLLTAPLCCALNDTRQIQQLNLGIVVMDDARNASQCGELCTGGGWAACVRLFSLVSAVFSPFCGERFSKQASRQTSKQERVSCRRGAIAEQAQRAGGGLFAGLGTRPAQLTAPRRRSSSSQAPRQLPSPPPKPNPSRCCPARPLAACRPAIATTTAMAHRATAATSGSGSPVPAQRSSTRSSPMRKAAADHPARQGSQ